MDQPKQLPTLTHDAIVAQGSQIANSILQQQLQAIAPVWQKAFQIVNAKTPQQPVDPAIQKTFEAAMAEIKRKAARDEEDVKLEQAKQKLAQDEHANNLQKAQAEFKTSTQETFAKFQADTADKERKFNQTMQLFQTEVLQQEKDRAAKAQADSDKIFIELLKLEQSNATLANDAAQKEKAFSDKLASMEQLPPPPDMTPHLQALGGVLQQLQQQHETTNANMGNLHNTMTGVMQHLAAPTELVRDPKTGKAIGTRKVMPK